MHMPIPHIGQATSHPISHCLHLSTDMYNMKIKQLHELHPSQDLPLMAFLHPIQTIIVCNRSVAANSSNVVHTSLYAPPHRISLSFSRVSQLPSRMENFYDPT
eukprot:GHVQ01041751.1.p1 GENE.GHVQ01041751.1~~GHVQ01041751.1.p1  ORF type:complete len:103 (-),score=8.68 GHVQ01041751.1:634-942(-)